jgi:uncharacterized protein (DUF2267 family)
VDPKEVIDAVAAAAGVSRDQAEALVRATLETLSERLTRGEARDLEAQLPKPFREPLRFSRSETAESFGLDEFIRRVSRRARVSEEEAAAGVRPALAKIRAAVSEKEWGDVMAQLGKDYAKVIT